MAPLRTYMLPAFAAIAAVRAANIEDFVPGCAPECINEAVDTHSTCEVDDGECLCRDIYSLKRHSEDCLEEACSAPEYGEAMLGYDEFCAALEDGPTTSTTSASVPPPETTETSAPPPPETTEEPEPTTTVTVPEEPTSVPEEPTSEPPHIPEIPEEPTEEPTMPTIEPTDSYTSISVPTHTGGTETFPSFTHTPIPMPTVSVPSNGTDIPEPTTSGGDGGGEPAPTTSRGDGGDGGDGGEPSEPPAEPTVSETPPPEAAGANFGVTFAILGGAAAVAAFFA